MDGDVIVNAEEMLRRICAEYLEMPGLRLRRQQAQRLWGLDEGTCAELLEFLVEQRFLHRTESGAYARSSDGIVTCPPLQMAKTSLPSKQISLLTGKHVSAA